VISLVCVGIAGLYWRAGVPSVAADAKLEEWVGERGS
jgi:hypothetical protein